MKKDLHSKTASTHGKDIYAEEILKSDTAKIKLKKNTLKSNFKIK